MRKQRAVRGTVVRARELRKRATYPERVLWGRIRNCGLAGMKFRRQHPIAPFVVDFFYWDKRLIVEVDGDSHDADQYEYDMRRQSLLEGQGLKVLRVTNDDVLQAIDSVLDGILKGRRRAAILSRDGGLRIAVSK